MRISVCIPTYNRLKTLKEAVESCFNQSRLPDEIVIGDDSESNETQQWIKEIQNKAPVKIGYYHNRPSLKQAGNVNQLFKYIEADLLILLHDDDLLMPEAIQHLFSCFLKNPEIDAAFGKQYLITDSGVVDKVGSESLNRDYYRSSEYEGLKLSSLESGFLQQFPNDAYLIKSNLAKEISYKEGAGDACDFDFALRLGMKNIKLYFINEYTAKYRISDDAINKKSDNNAGVLSFKFVESLKVPAESMAYKNRWLREKAPVAIADATNIRSYADATHIYFSKWHYRKIITPGGIKRLFRILLFAIIRPGQKDYYRPK